MLGGSVTYMAKHKFDDCPESGCEYPIRCGWCEGNKSHCTGCKLAEGKLTTECPGTLVHPDTQDAIMDGRVDYRDGEWKEVTGFQ